MYENIVALHAKTFLTNNRLMRLVPPSLFYLHKTIPSDEQIPGSGLITYAIIFLLNDVMDADCDR
jgi:hypothetical protein